MVQAFAKRIRDVNGILNAVVDDRIEAAIKDAEAVDKMLDSGAISEKEAQQTKPFLGVPFTTKESTSCKGKQTANIILYYHFVLLSCCYVVL